MNATAPPQNNKFPPGLQKAVLIGASALLCLLIYVIIGLQKPNTPAITVLSPSPAPHGSSPYSSPTPLAPTPAPTPAGVRAIVLLDRYAASGLLIGEYDESTKRCTVQITSLAGATPAPATPTPEGLPALPTPPPYGGMLEFVEREGYARGFILELPALSPPSFTGKPDSLFEEGIRAGQQLKYERESQAQMDLIHTVLTDTLAALDQKGNVSASVVLLWESGADSLLKGGENYTNQAGPFTFTAMRSRSGALMVSLTL